DERAAVDVAAAIGAKQHHRQSARRHDHVGASIEQDAAFALPLWHELLLRILARIGVDEIGHGRLHCAHADDTALDAIADDLVFMPRDEYRIDGHEAQL